MKADRRLCVVVAALVVALACERATSAADEPAEPLYFAKPSIEVVEKDASVPAVSVAIAMLPTTDGHSFPSVHVEPSRLTVRYRRIDGTLRPWVGLHTNAEASDVQPDTTVTVPFGTLPSTRGATYEIALDVGSSLAWNGPAPTVGTFSDLQDQLGMACGSCFETAAQALARRSSTALLTVPSATSASVAREFAALRHEWLHRRVRVIRSGAVVTIDFSSPHATSYEKTLAVGQFVTIKDIAAAVGPTLTSTAPLGVPAGARIPPKSPRFSLSGVVVSIAEPEEWRKEDDEGESFALTFASPGEARRYLSR